MRSMHLSAANKNVGPITSRNMRALHPAVKTVLVALAVLVVLGFALVCVGIWQFGVAHQLAALQVGDYQLRLKLYYHYDVSNDVLCELRGPKQQHPAQIIAFIGAGETAPVFSIHQATNRQVFWITAETFPKTILYAVDVETGEHWPPRDSEEGQKFLELANRSQSGYRLYQYEWIGVKKQVLWATAAQPSS